MKEFRCERCGECCSVIGGNANTSSDDLDFIKRTFYGQMPILQVIPLDKMVMPLFDWEAERLNKKAEELGISVNIIPLQVVFDTKTKKSIVLKYGLDHIRCPFLHDNNSCRIYSARPFVCKQFPFQKGPFMDDDISTDEKVFTPAKLNSRCPAIKDLSFDNSAGSNIKALHDLFGDTFMAAMQNDLINIWLNSVVIAMMKKDIIKPLMKVDYDVAIEKIKNSKTESFTDFLVSSKMHPREEMDMLINLFEEYDDVKEKVKELLGKDDNNRADKTA